MRALSGARAAALALLGAVLAAQGEAHAAGVEDTVTGTIALGRSANYARVGDFMAVWQNPANLAIVGGRDLGLDLRLPLFRGCFDRARDNSLAGTTGAYLPTESFGQECEHGGPGLAGNVGFALPLPRGFGFGVGLYTPGGVPRAAYGSDKLNTVGALPGETLPTTSGARESGSRYLMLSRDTLAAYLMVGVAYQPLPTLRFGLSVGSGFVNVRFKSVSSVFGGLFNDAAQVADLAVQDSFVPRVTASIAGTPLDSVDVFAALTWNDDIEAKGHLDVTSNGFVTAPQKRCTDDAPGPRCRADDVTLRIPYQRLELVVGGRYAARRPGQGRTRALEPMRDEIWDVELNALWSETSHVDSYDLDIYGPNDRERKVAVSSSPAGASLPLPQRQRVPHNWRDTYGLRLGGDYNVLPERLALRAGVAYESNAVPTANMNIDYWPVRKVTLSVGATAAFGRYRLSIAYAHLFFQTVTVDVGEGAVRESAASYPVAGVPAQVVNEGRYKASLDVLSLQGNVRF